jgi:L-lactate dehydrogenase complex protein LldE
MSAEKPDTALFITCLADLFRPAVGFATVKLLERAGCAVDVPMGQTCCGQPAYNSGDSTSARALALQTIRLLSDYDHVVAPSGSCAAMIRLHYPALLAGDPEWAERARALAGRTWELTQFLHQVMKYDPSTDEMPEKTTYLDSCSGLRELGVSDAPRALLRGSVLESGDSDACCGFGGTFCVKYTAVSTAIADKKLDSLAATGATRVAGGDLGCLMHLAGRAARRGLDLEFRHVAEVLAGETQSPAIAARDN